MKSVLKCYRHTFQRTGATRGKGVLERFLALHRVRLAKRLLQKSGYARIGTLIDIGCGTYPLFLLTSGAVKRYGLDRIENVRPSVRRRAQLVHFDIEESRPLPFDDQTADVISLLAVFEHIEHERLEYLFREIFRCLKPSGVCIVTTPSVWSDPLLRLLARLRVVSPAEIEEHKEFLTTPVILDLFRKAGFFRTEHGFFEFFLNRWFVLKKDSAQAIS